MHHGIKQSAKCGKFNSNLVVVDSHDPRRNMNKDVVHVDTSSWPKVVIKTTEPPQKDDNVNW